MPVAHSLDGMSEWISTRPPADADALLLCCRVQASALRWGLQRIGLDHSESLEFGVGHRVLHPEIRDT